MNFILEIARVARCPRVRPEGAAALVEYALLTSLVSLASIAAVKVFGQQVAAEFVSISSAI